MKLSVPKGMRDVAPAQKIVLNQIVAVLENTFARYGYAPLDTPLVERMDVLSSKYAGGSEILKEVFSVTDQGKRKLGLRYELTVPFARFVGMNPQLKLPFKRYQIGKVYRDGPVASGRLREFTQCDCDVVGPATPLVDAELLALVASAFSQLTLDVDIRVNDRKLLNGMVGIFSAKKLSAKQRDAAILTIDKLDKIGQKGVVKELVAAKLFAKKDAVLLLTALARFEKKRLSLAAFSTFLEQEAAARTRDFAVAQEGLAYLAQLFAALASFGVTSARFYPSLARGLAYYTGPIFEFYLEGGKMAVGAGGRYDNMVGDFLGSGSYPACGVSFGLDRIALALGGADAKTLTQVFVLPVGPTVLDACSFAAKLRAAGVRCEVDLVGKSISKNLDYASKLGIPFVLFVGRRELASGKLKVKNMKSGKESFVTKRGLVSGVRKLLGSLK